jgi:hypothetical protein
VNSVSLVPLCFKLDIRGLERLWSCCFGCGRRLGYDLCGKKELDINQFSRRFYEGMISWLSLLVRNVDHNRSSHAGFPHRAKK